MIPIKDWPADERPREKLMLRGAQALSDAELLAIFLRTGTRGKTAVDLSRELLHDFGSLRAMFDASEMRFCEANGLGPAKFVQLQAILEMSKRYLRERMQRGDVLEDPDAVRFYLASKLRDRPAEVFACVFLDNRHRVIQLKNYSTVRLTVPACIRAKWCAKHFSIMRQQLFWPIIILQVSPNPVSLMSVLRSVYRKRWR